jgi:polyhydroxyalkanoate synthesis regulator phasin
MNKQFKRMQKLAGILTEGYQGTDYESSEDMALDTVKTGTGMPGTGLPEAKKKMTRAEAKQAIKDAILTEMTSEDNPLGEASSRAMERMQDLVNISTVGSLVDAAGRIIGDLKYEGFEEDDIYDFLMDKLRTLSIDESLEEAKKKESKKDDEGEAEEEVDLDLDMDLETDSEDASIDMDMNATPDMDVSSEDAKNTFDDLAKAYQAAKNLGDEKLIQQLANTITYFNKNIILK